MKESTENKDAQNPFFAIQIEKGGKYFWCSCKESQTQPLCDGTHKGTQYRPLLYKSQEEKKVFFCGCKQTKTPPFCDGTHKSLSK